MSDPRNNDKPKPANGPKAEQQPAKSSALGKSPPVKAKAPEVKKPEPTQDIQEGFTPQEEAAYRGQEGVGAPTIADIEAAGNPAAAQDIATVALLMGEQGPSIEDAPTVEEFVEDYDKDGMIGTAGRIERVQGRTHEDMKQRENLEVAMISSSNPPKEVLEQRAEGRSHLPSAVVPESRRSLSLEELATRKIELANPGMPGGLPASG